MTEDRLLNVLEEIRDWIRVSSWSSVKASLEAALPDAKSRAAFQMFDGNTTVDQVRVACKMSPNAVVALTARCTSLGLMEVTPDKRRRRLFDLTAFGLLASTEKSEVGVGK